MTRQARPAAVVDRHRLCRSVGNDVRQALRAIRASPANSAGILVLYSVTLATAATVYGIVFSVLATPLPYPAPEQLVLVRDSGNRPFSFREYEQLRDGFAAADGAVAAYGDWVLPVRSTALSPRPLNVEFVSDNYFATLGVAPWLYHGATRGKLSEGDHLILVSFDLWQREYAGRVDVTGTPLTIREQQYLVAGVLPRGFRGQSGVVDIWLPLQAAPRVIQASILSDGDGSRQFWLNAIGRFLRPSLRVQRIGGVERPVELTPLRDAKIDPLLWRGLCLLAAAASAMLLLGIASALLLSLGRIHARRHEYAVRVAIGGSPARIACQVFLETGMVMFAGGLIGLFAAAHAIERLSQAQPWALKGVPAGVARSLNYFSLTIDWRVVSLCIAATALSAVVVSGLVRFRFLNGLRPQTVSWIQNPGPHTRLVRSTGTGIIFAEVFIATVLLGVAAVLGLNAVRLLTLELGFRRDGLVTARLDTNGVRMPLTFYETTAATAEQLMGSGRVALSSTIPATPMTLQTVQVSDRRDGPAPMAVLNIVTPSFFEVYDVHLLAGRRFTNRDDVAAAPVAIVSRAMADRTWPGQDPVGRRVRTPFRTAAGRTGGWFEVVGVVSNVMYGVAQDHETSAVYLPAAQPFGRLTAVALPADVISAISPARGGSALAWLSGQMRSSPGEVALFDLATMSERVQRSYSQYVFGAQTGGGLATIALLITIGSVFGMVSWFAAQRARELAVRVALGATPARLTGAVLRDWLLAIIAGAATALTLLVSASEGLEAVLLGPTPVAWRVFMGSSGAIVIASLGACYPVVRRVLRVNPIALLRE